MSDQEQKGLRNRFTYSPSIGALISALCKAQLEFEEIKKETENPAYARGGKAMKYADLSTIIAATQPALAKNGVAILQSPDVEISDQSMTLTGLMAHSSGEWIRCETTLPAVQRDRFDPQSCGSAVTYARRYQYKSLIGAAEEDDDANAASGVGSSQAAKDVANRKIAEGRAKAAAGPSQRVTCLFYVESQEHKGFVDWLNIGQYVESNEDKADALRMVFTAHGAKKRGDATLVPVDRIPSLLEKLAGDLGVDVKQLQARD